MPAARSTLTALFDAMEADISAALQRLANDHLERQVLSQKRERLAARRLAAGAVPVLYFLPTPAPTPSAWEQERDFGLLAARAVGN